MQQALVIFLGSGLGGVSRWWIAGLISERWGHAFPWGTLVVNVSGSLAIGLFAGLADGEGRYVASMSLRQFFMIGICGGYTTFSSFSLQTLALAQNGQWLRAGGNVALSVVLCLVAVAAGHGIGGWLAGARSGG